MVIGKQTELLTAQTKELDRLRAQDGVWYNSRELWFVLGMLTTAVTVSLVK